jgi:four helix bundle protein
MRRAAISIASNIAEGAARKGPREYVRFLYMARGSASELDTQLEIASQLAFLGDEARVNLQSRVDEVNRMLNGMIVALTKRAHD